MSRLFEPIPMPYSKVLYPDQSDPTLVGSWLNAKVPGADDYSASGGNDGTPAGGYQFESPGILLDGTDGTVDFTNVGTIAEVAMWVKPGSTSEQLFRIDAGKTVSLVTGTVTHTGITASATYVDGAAGTTMVAGKWQLLVCQFTADAAANFELGYDGTNYGNIEVMDLRVYSAARSGEVVAEQYSAGVPDPELVLSVPFGDVDYSRFKRALTVSPGVVSGRTITLDGVAYIRTAAIDGIENGATMAMWFKPRIDDDFVLLNNTPHVNRRTTLNLYTGGLIRAGYWTGATYRSASGTGVKIGAWNHVVAAYDGDETMMLVLNGVQLTGTDAPGAGSNVFLDIGRSTGGSDPFDGQLRDVRYYLGAKSLGWALDDRKQTRIYY